MLRLTLARSLLGCLALILAQLGGPWMPLAAAQDATPTPGQPVDPQAFSQTGFRVGDLFWDYLLQHGGVGVLGYPVSRVFTYSGRPAQLFQRELLLQGGDGSVGAANLLDPGGLLPFTHLNGTQLPGEDPGVIMVTPMNSQPQYDARMQEFLSDTVPDSWDDQPVSFLSTYQVTPDCADLADPATCTTTSPLLLGLQIWGPPLSRPTSDPTTPNVIYQLFQRGVMSYDAACRCTQRLLIGDDLKSVLTGQSLDPGLAADVKASPLLRQYDPSRPGSVARPEMLPGADLTNAFVKDVGESS